MRRHRASPALIVTILMALALVVLPVGASAQERDAPVNPEAAIAAYIAGISEGDVEAILAASAVDEMAAGFDFGAYTERLQALALTTSMAPSEYPMFAAANRYQQASWILGQVRNLTYGLLSDETIDGSIIAPADAERVAAFVAAVDPTRLADLRLLDVGIAAPDIVTSDRYLENVARMAAAYGADELTERLALIELDGRTYGLGFTLLRYGDVWKVSNQASVIAGTSALGTAEPMTPQEFGAATGD